MHSNSETDTHASLSPWLDLLHLSKADSLLALMLLSYPNGSPPPCNSFPIINDYLEQKLRLLYEHMMSNVQTGGVTGHNTIASALTDIITGKEDANFASPAGKYKFFTCSNDTLRCDKYVFNASSILIAGNGDFNVKHYTGRFNAYQRTYVLMPGRKYYGLLYLASLYQINSFKSTSAGSIVKFLTKADIENIPVFIPDNEEVLSKINHLLMLQEQYQVENDELAALRDWLLPMLMNGQATIED